MASADHIKWFRDSSPYIDAHRGRTFVVCLGCDAMACDNLPNIVSDIALLNSLGVRLVLVLGGDRQIDAALAALGETRQPGARRPITSASQISTVTRVMGELTAELTAHFSSSAVDSPSKRREARVVTGNFVKARPIGIVSGMCHAQSGEVRKVNREAIEDQLAAGAIVLLPSIGYSPSGEIFHLDAESVARDAACATAADKLIYLAAMPGLLDVNGKVISEIDLSHQAQFQFDGDESAGLLLEHCRAACNRGVERCHVVSFNQDGAILEELFTRDGCGTQIIGHSYEQIRPALIDDVPGILKLIAPLEDSGVLVKRSRELLESEISRFIVIERDGLLISCAALYPFDDAGELACLVTHPDYRNGDRGDRLLDRIELAARQQQMSQLFVLTTQSADWFRERNFW